MPLTPVTWLNEFTVNLTTTGTQIAPVITQLTNGNIVVVWQSDNDTGVGAPAGIDLIGQIFDPLGNRIGGEFLVNGLASADPEAAPAITALAGGGFAVAFERLFADIFNDILLHTFDANGTALQSKEIFIDFDSAPPIAYDPVIASSSATSILTVWREDEFGGDSSIVGLIFDPTTDNLGSPISLIDTALTESDPVVAVLNNGNYVIACRTELAGGDSQITLRIISSTGANVLGAVAVPGTAGDFQREREPAITALEDGGFVVSWTRVNVTPQNYIEFQMFTEAGVAVGGVVTVTNSEEYEQSVVVALPDGGFIVAWDDNFTSTASLSAQRYDLNGAAVGGVFAFAPGAALANLDAVTLADGRIALTFTRADGEIGMEILDVRDAPTTGDHNPNDYQIGTIGDDTFTADASSTLVYGHTGNDAITATGALRSYYGGDGDDTLSANPVTTADVMYGGSGIDWIDWSGSNIDGAQFNLEDGFVLDGQFLTVMDGFENLIGSSGNDVIIGSSAANVILGGAGNDVITGPAGPSGVDDVLGGAGNDTLYTGQDGGNYYGDGNDDVIVVSAIVGAALSAEGGTEVDTIDLTLRDEDVSLNMVSGATGFANTTLLGFEVVLLGDGDDTVEGTAGNDSIYGGAGDDLLIGSAGDDSLSGGLGSDYFVGGAGINTFDGGNDDAEIDFVVYQESTGDMFINMTGPNLNTGDAAGDFYIGIEGIIGGSGSNVILGDGAANVFYGLDGEDFLYGGGGDDLLDGGFGNDSLRGGLGADILIGGSGFDLAGYDLSAGAVRVDLSNTALNTGEAAGDAYFSIEWVRGGTFNDTLSGNSGANALSGNNGNDAVYGRSGADSLYGGDGNDVLLGGAGADRLDGGTGTRDRAQYSDAASGVLVDLLTPAGNTGIAAGDSFVGVEDLYGSDFADTLFGDSGGNMVWGALGDDVLYGRVGPDQLYGGDGNDILLGGAGADVLDGGAGARDRVQYSDATAGLRADLQTPASNTGFAAGDGFAGIEDLHGSTFNDTLFGDAGGNILWGAAGNDALNGRGGADTLQGGTGNDVLTGGVGIDHFVFNSALGATNVDQITDFVVADDTIRLENAIFTALAATGTLAGTAFALGAATTAAHRIVYNSATGQVFYDINGNAAGGSTLFATLTPGLALTAADFLVI